MVKIIPGLHHITNTRQVREYPDSSISKVLTILKWWIDHDVKKETAGKAEGTELLNPLKPIVHFWLHHTAHCAEKIVSVRLRAGSASAERVGQGEVGGVTGRVPCTWWLLGLALKRPWLVPGGPPHALTAWTGLENTTLTLQRAGFLQERLLGL